MTANDEKRVATKDSSAQQLASSGTDGNRDTVACFPALNCPRHRHEVIAFIEDPDGYRIELIEKPSSPPGRQQRP